MSTLLLVISIVVLADAQSKLTRRVNDNAEAAHEAIESTTRSMATAVLQSARQYTNDQVAAAVTVLEASKQVVTTEDDIPLTITPVKEVIDNETHYTLSVSPLA